MPRRPRVPCGHPGCPELIEPGTKFCEKHKSLHPEITRPAAKRGYGSRWQKASKAFLQSHPLCAECRKQGRYTKATVVDHIVPHRGDQKLFWDRSNWQPLCKACHDRKTGRLTPTNFSPMYIFLLPKYTMIWEKLSPDNLTFLPKSIIIWEKRNRSVRK